jgi:hypothetical protein
MKPEEEKQTIENYNRLIRDVKNSEQKRWAFRNRRDQSVYPYGMNKSWEWDK